MTSLREVIKSQSIVEESNQLNSVLTKILTTNVLPSSTMDTSKLNKNESNINVFNKQEVKVALLLTKPYIYESTGFSNKYEGFFYDVYEKVKSKLQHKYRFKETFIKRADYDNVVNEVRMGKYDLAIAPFRYDSFRTTVIDYTSPIIIDKTTIIHKVSNIDFLATMAKTMGKVIIPLLAIILVIGVILGYVLFKAERYRGLTRSIVTVAASMFGESGFVSEESKLSLGGIAIVAVIFIVSFLFSIILDSYFISQAVVLSQETSSLTPEDIQGKTFILPKGYMKSYETIITSNGGKVEVMKGSISELIEKIDNEKYFGVITNVSAGSYVLKDKSGYALSTNINSTSKPSAFILNKKNNLLKNDINKTIIDLQNKFEITPICNHYFPNDSYMCEL